MNKAFSDSTDAVPSSLSRYSDGFAMTSEKGPRHTDDTEHLPPAVDGLFSQLTSSVYRFFSADSDSRAASSTQIDMMLQQTAKWTVHTADDVVIRSWKLKPLLRTCQNDVILSAMLRKAFSQSAIQKVLAMETAQVSFPFGWEDSAGATRRRQ